MPNNQPGLVQSPAIPVTRQPDIISHLVEHIVQRTPACGSSKVIAFDGPSGSGKSTLVGMLANVLEFQLISMESLYRGWHGLDAGSQILTTQVLEPLASGQHGSFRPWNWHTQSAEEVVCARPDPLIVIDGVGSGSRHAHIFTSLLVWVEADEDMRKRRALSRDRGSFDEWWDVWAHQEDRFFRLHGTKSAADIHVHSSAVA